MPGEQQAEVDSLAIVCKLPMTALSIWPEDDQKEGLLGYDDTAFYYFFSSVRAAQILL